MIAEKFTFILLINGYKTSRIYFNYYCRDSTVYLSAVLTGKALEVYYLRALLTGKDLKFIILGRY